jgi:hypothetical protein
MLPPAKRVVRAIGSGAASTGCVPNIKLDPYPVAGSNVFWLGEYKFTCLAIADASGGLLAYAYYSNAASRPTWNREPRRVGPVAARTTRLQLSLLRAIGETMRAHAAETVEFRVPGINMTGLSALLGAGFRIDHVGQFMASRTFGRFDRYLPSGGTLL